MEIKKEKLQELFDTLTNYPAVSKEQVIHEFNKAFGEEAFIKDAKEDEDAQPSVELKDLKHKVREWYNKVTERRCILCIATEFAERDEDDTVTYISLLGSDKNVIVSIAEAFEKEEKVPNLVNKATKLATINLLSNMLSDEKKRRTNNE